MHHPTAKTAPRRTLPSSAPRSVILRVVHCPDARWIGAGYDLTSPRSEFTFGRSGAAAIEDPRLSRQHCRVSRVDGAVRVEDLGSSNGSFVQGHRAEREYLMPNQVLRIGDTLFVLDEETPFDQSLPAAMGEADVPELVGESFAAGSVRRSIAIAGPTEAAVLLLGPSGSGKEIAARALHRLSGRAGAFVAVNCGAITPELADAELFGHSKGAFTGADRERLGLFGEAHRGTLFLDEIGDLPPALQVKLLRAIEERRIRPVGESRTRDVDVRVVAATNVHLEGSGFREDLRARLGQWEIQLPPLTARRSDILLLARHLIRRSAATSTVGAWTAEFAEALVLHDWPLNVRELQNVVQRLVLSRPHDSPWDFTFLPAPLQRPLLQREEGQEDTGAPGRAELKAALEEAEGNVARVAQKFGRDRTQVYRWLRRYQVDPQSYR
jgi:DNA-binding NtrC family response regulator